MDGKTALGASSPAKPALHMPEPLSTTRAATSSSAILDLNYFQQIIVKKMRLCHTTTVDLGLKQKSRDSV